MIRQKPFFRYLSTVVDATTTRPGPRLPRPPRAKRAAVLSELRHVGRVHAPEADMRPLLPQRDLLLKSVTNTHSSRKRHHQPSPSRYNKRPARTGLALLCDESTEYAISGDMEALSRVIRRSVLLPDASDVSLMDESTMPYRAVTMNAVLGATRVSSQHRVDAVMNVLTAHGMLDLLSPLDIGAVLDVLIRDKLRRDDIEAALRGELMSRALDTRIAPGTYASLINHCDRLDSALSLLHRAFAVGVVPNISMLNRILDLCFLHGDGARARRVVAEMARRDLPPNLNTISTLVRRADSIDGIDAVFSVVRQHARLQPDVAAVFLRAYVGVGLSSGDEEYVGRCFSVIDWCFEHGLGVRRRTMDDLVAHFATHGKLEAALRAWREMRRGWLGQPSLHSRRALWVELGKRGSKRDERLQSRLANGLSNEQLQKMRKEVFFNVGSMIA